MLLPKFDELPKPLQFPEIKPYYEFLHHRRGRLICKRVFDFFASFLLILLLSPLFAVIGIWIACDSKGPVFFRQTRITQFGKPFSIYKFRTMVVNAPELGAPITTKEDTRVTGAGKFLRRLRMDELPQLFNVLKGQMSFVGVRPEVPRYVREYTPKMMATLLLPAGITSPASIAFSKEEELLADSKDPEKTYLERILPQKMKSNLSYIQSFSLTGDLKILWQTVQTIFFSRKEEGS